MPGTRVVGRAPLYAVVGVLVLTPGLCAQGVEYVTGHYTKTEYMVSMRDGVKLFTIVYAPKDASQKYPIMINRTPYGIPPYGPDNYRRLLGPSPEFDRLLDAGVEDWRAIIASSDQAFGKPTERIEHTGDRDVPIVFEISAEKLQRAKEILASRAAREAAAQNLEAERRRYENGMTTNFQVLQIQQQLSDARAREILALVAYNKSVAAYHRAIGDLLDVANIKVEEPKIEEPTTFRVFDRYNWLNYGSRIQSNTTEAKQ